MRYRIHHEQPNGYMQSRSETEWMAEESYGGHALRCGLTAPGEPDRATYRLYSIEERIDDVVYIYEDVWFIPVSDWRAQCLEPGGIDG